MTVMSLEIAGFGPEQFAAETGVSRETLGRLERYRELLLEANQGLSLIGDSTIPTLWERHFLDSAQLLPLLPSPEAVVLDMGTGAGLPGLVLAILGCPNVHLAEHNMKKATFLRRVIDELGLPTQLHAKKAESIPAFPVDVVTARAFAPLPELIGLARPFLGTAGICLFLKGRNAEAELDLARRSWRCTASLLPSRTAPDARIVRLSEIHPA